MNDYANKALHSDAENRARERRRYPPQSNQGFKHIASSIPEVDDVVTRNASAFEKLQFEEHAQRKHHLQASGFFWSDELPHENDVTELEPDYHRLIVFLISYRAQLALENVTTITKYSPVWAAFKSRCPDWPGFHASRCSTALADELRAADSNAANELAKIFRACERSRERKSQD